MFGQAATEWAAGAGVLPPAGCAAAADALTLQGWNHTDAVGRWGRGDNAGAVLRGGLHAALAAGGSFRAGVRLCIRAGGDSCSRCAGLGGTVPWMQGRSLEGCAMQASEPALNRMSSWPVSSLQEYYGILSLLIKYWTAFQALCGLCRAHVTGAVLAAAAGEEALPKAWRRKAAKYMDVKQMVHVVAMQRTTFVPFVIDRSGAGPASGSAAEAV